MFVCFFVCCFVYSISVYLLCRVDGERKVYLNKHISNQLLKLLVLRANFRHNPATSTKGHDYFSLINISSKTRNGVYEKPESKGKEKHIANVFRWFVKTYRFRLAISSVSMRSLKMGGGMMQREASSI